MLEIHRCGYLGQRLLECIINSGVNINNRQEVIDEINEAIEKGTLVTIFKKGSAIGFFTYFEHGDEVFMNNCLIFGEKDRNNLLSLRNTFRERFKDKRFTWESLKRQRMVSVK